MRNKKEQNKVMEIYGGVDAENRDIYMSNFNGKIEQQWDLIYAKDWKGEPKKGEWNRDWGFIVDMDFHIVSLLGEGRYIDYATGRNLVIKTPNGRKSQKWYFHQPSRTVRSRPTNQSIDIHNSGKSNHLQYYSTSSRWW
jgi:hypothetical protein